MHGNFGCCPRSNVGFDGCGIILIADALTPSCLVAIGSLVTVSYGKAETRI